MLALYLYWHDNELRKDIFSGRVGERPCMRD